MAYGLKYWFEFDDIHTVTPAVWKVNISFKDFTGTSTEIINLGADPLVFIRGVQSEDKFEPILGSEADITIMIDDEKVIKPTDFTDIDEDEALVEIYKDTVLYWKGFIKQDFISYRYTSTPYLFTIPATDRISLMKASLLDIGDEINGIGFVQLADLLTTKGLYKTNLCSTLKLLSSLTHPTPDGMTYPDTGGVQLSFLDQLKIRYELLIDDSGNPMNVYDTLVMLARSFGGRIFYSGGYYHFQRINDLYTNAPLVAIYTDQLYPDSRAASPIRKILKGEISSSDGVYANNNASIQVEGAHKQDKIDLDYTQRGFLENYGWGSYVDGEFTDWDSEIMNSPTFPPAWDYISQGGSGTIAEPYYCFFEPVPIYTGYIKQDVTGIIPGNVYTLKFKVKFYTSQRAAYQIHLYEDTIDEQSDSHFYFNGSTWVQAKEQASSGNNPLSGSPNYHVKFSRPQDVRKNEVTIEVTLPKIPDLFIPVAEVTLAPNIIRFMVIDPDGSVSDGADKTGIEIYAVELGHQPYGYTGEVDTMRNTGNYSILNDDNEIKIIDGFDAFANSINYGSYGVNNGGTIGSWGDDYLTLGVSESHLMTLRGIAEQNRKQYKSLTTSVFSNTLEFENVIQQAFGDFPLFLQMSDKYSVRNCIHELQLLQVNDSTGAKATSKQTYKF